MKITRSMTKERILEHLEGMPSELMMAGRIIKVLNDAEGEWVKTLGRRESRVKMRRAIGIAEEYFEL